MENGGIYTITEPVNAADYEDLVGKLEKVSFMYAGTLGTGIEALLLKDVAKINANIINGIVIVGNSAERLRDMNQRSGLGVGRRNSIYSLQPASNLRTWRTP